MAITNKVAIGQRSEVTGTNALKAAFAEFIATFIFVFIGVGSIAAYFKGHDGDDVTAAGLVSIALAHGLSLTVVIAATANISGGHVNPAVTLGLAVGGNITILRGLLYWIGQFGGAVAASLILKFLVVVDEPVALHDYGLGVGAVGALVVEIILTFALVFVVYATAVDPKKGSVGVIAPLAIGFTVLASLLVGVPYSGASLNPARSFGPALANLDFTHFWIYLVGPLIGALIATFVYDSVFLSPGEEGTAVPTEEQY